MKPGKLVLVVLSVTTALAVAGCAGPGSPSSSVDPAAGDAEGILRLPWPAPNVTYAYETHEGSRLEVTLADVATRKGPWLEDHRGWSIVLQHTPAGEDARTWRFEETVDPDTGLTIQHWARCASRDKGDDGSWECVDDRGEAIPSAWGFPGGLGAAPFWGVNLTDEDIEVAIDPVVGPREDWRYDVAQTRRSPVSTSRCLRLTGEREAHRGFRALETAAGMDGFTLCEGHAFPVSFTSNRGERYRLVDRSGDPGERLPRPPPDGGPPRASPEPVVAMANRSPPVYASHPERPTPFPTEEAHRVARERVDAYDALFAGGEALVVRSWYSHEGHTTRAEHDPRGDSDRYERRIVAVDDRGRFVRVTVHKHVHEEGQGPFEGDSDYEIEETKRGRSRSEVPTAASLVGRQAAVDEVVRLGENLTGRPFDEGMGFGLWGSFKATPRAEEPDGWRLNGSTVIAWYEPESAEGEGFMVYSPLRFTVDGPAGAVLSVQGPRDTLNETMR